MSTAPSKSHKLNSSDIMLAGATAGFLTRALCQPLDVLKIRFQLQVEPIKKLQTSKYQSILQALFLICKEEGAKALWKGHFSAQIISVLYGLVQFSVFDMLMKQAHAANFTDYKALVIFNCGAISGCSATVVSFPFDVVRTRMVAQSENKRIYSGITNAFKQIIKKEGVLGLYRGLLPTFIQVAPHSGVQFMCYKIFMNVYKTVFKIDESVYSFTGSAISGSLAGLVAKTSVYPLDLVKKRMQIQGIVQHRAEFGKVFVCKGMLNCLHKIYVHEGIIGLFKGLHPSLLKAVVTTCLHFTFYETACKIISDFKF